MSAPGPPNFDRLAGPYRWLEYLTLGPALQRTRTLFLSRLPCFGRALVMGDGDGRFTAALLEAHPALRVQAVDSSPAMLRALRHRCPPAAALTTTVGDLRDLQPEHPVDLITSHFVLDCLTQPEVDALLSRFGPCLRAGGLWLVSDFRVPQGVLHWPARAYIRLLYFAFRVLTGLRVTRLPDHAAAMRRAGLQLVDQQLFLAGLLMTQLWQKPPLGRPEHMVTPGDRKRS